MTIKQNVATGNADGAAEFIRLSGINAAYVKKTNNEALADARVIASNWVAHTRNRSTVYFEAFVSGYMTEWRKAHYALPEVQEAERLRYFKRLLDRSETQAQGIIDAFRDKLMDDHNYTLRWADSAFEASAMLVVVAKVKQVFEAQGIDAAVKFAHEETMHRAASSSRSTSACSNLSDDAMRKAYAAFAIER